MSECVWEEERKRKGVSEEWFRRGRGEGEKTEGRPYEGRKEQSEAGTNEGTEERRKEVWNQAGKKDRKVERMKEEMKYVCIIKS